MNNIKRFFKRTNWLFKNHSNKIQNISAFIGSIGVVLALGLSINNYIDAKEIESKNIRRDSIQLTLLDSIANQLQLQSVIASAQYKSQVELNKPVISFYRFTGHDSLKYNSFRWKGKYIWRMPYFKFDYSNFGTRPAYGLKVQTTCYCLISNIVFSGVEESFSHPIVSKSSEYYFHIPLIPEDDIDKFYMRIITTWNEKTESHISSDTLFLSCQRHPSGKYKITYMHDFLKDKVSQLENGEYPIVKSNTMYSFIREKIYGF